MRDSNHNIREPVPFSGQALKLLEALRAEPERFDLFQALRVLECAHPERPRIGTSLRPADDPVRLGQEPSLAFAPSTISAVGNGRGPAPRLEQRAFGLFGPNGPLPLHLTEYARERARNFGDPTFARFADVFHHRMLSLFYRAWAAAQPTVQFDRPESDRFAMWVASLLGIGMPSLRNRDAMPDLAKLHFAGRLGCQTRSAEGLQAVLETFFRIPAEIEQFVAHWMEIPADCRLRLGDSPETGALGHTATIGARVWDCQHKFRIVLGPMDLDEYRRLLPGGESLKRLVAIVRNYAGDDLLWDLNLVLKREEVPETRLGLTGQLGRTTWLKSRDFPHDASDLVLAGRF